MEPSSSAAAGGGASLELAVDPTLTLTSTCSPAATSKLLYVSLLGARPRSTHISSARGYWRVPGRSSKRPFACPSPWAAVIVQHRSSHFVASRCGPLTTGQLQRAGYLRDPLGSQAIQGGQVLHLEGLFERRRYQMLAGAPEPLTRMRFP